MKNRSCLCSNTCTTLTQPTSCDQRKELIQYTSPAFHTLVGFYQGVFIPGRTYSIPVHASAGETISLTTSSGDYWDTILVLLSPDGTPVAGAELDWVAAQTGTYMLQVTFFESVNSGEVMVTRD